MLPFRLVYHDGYDLNLGAHVFPSQKYRLTRERLLGDAFAVEEDFLEPEPASDEQLLLVHHAGWVDRLRHGTLSFQEIIKLEIPYSRRMAEAFFLAAGGTILAARRALQDGVGFNVGGGFHHAFPGHGEGFCAIHDVAVAIRALQKSGEIHRASVIDLDVHQGNGTATVFGGDRRVCTVSFHQLNNYPTEKPPSTIDIHLPDDTGDKEYLGKLREVISVLLSACRPDLLLYVAGADPYMEDQLGGLALTIEGLLERDRIVFEAALSRRVPVAVTLAGGYAYNVNDTVTIHANTARAARDVLLETGWHPRTDTGAR